MPSDAACRQKRGQSPAVAVSWMFTGRACRRACSAGPSPDWYCTRSASDASGSLHAVADGGAAPLPKRHPARHRLAFTHGPRREHRELMQELLDAVGFQQGVLQPREVCLHFV